MGVAELAPTKRKRSRIPCSFQLDFSCGEAARLTQTQGPVVCLPLLSGLLVSEKKTLKHHRPAGPRSRH